MSSLGPASGPLPQPSTPLPPTLDTRRQSFAPRPAREPIVPWVTDGLIRKRKLAILASLIPIIISFNGRWRMGLDSSIYRGLARSIANGLGYHFGEFGTHQIYPGLPVLLAGVTKIFGEHVFRPLAPLVLMVTMSLLTLVMIYRLIARNYPQWMAICVTVFMATNFWFVKLSHEVLTDIPFLLGSIAALLGWDLLKAAGDTRQRTRGGTLMVAGLAVAALMRPTFWILCLALLVTWSYGLIRGLFKGGWKLYAVCLGVLVLLCLTFWAIDPRTSGSWHPLSGGYEAEMLETIQDSNAPQVDGDTPQPLRQRVEHELTLLFTQHLAASFLGQQLPSVPNVILSILLIGSAALMARKQPLWAMFIVFTIGVTVTLSTEPRYYVMIMPFLLLGAFLLLRKIGEWFGGGWCDAVFGIGLLLLLILNVAKIVPFVYEQQRVPFYESGLRFYDHYRGGKLVPVMRLADLVRDKVPPGAKVISPSAQIVRYLADREVMMERELLPMKKGQRHYPERLATENIAFAAFPARIYDKERMLAQLIKHGVIVAGRSIGVTSDGIRLAQAIILVPAGDWTKASPPPRTTRPTTKPTTKKVRATSRPSTAKLKAAARKKIEAKAAKLHKQKHATTTPSTKKKKKKRPSTAPVTQPSQ